MVWEISILAQFGKILPRGILGLEGGGSLTLAVCVSELWQVTCDMWHLTLKKINEKFILVLLSVHVKRFSLSGMPFFIILFSLGNLSACVSGHHYTLCTRTLKYIKVPEVFRGNMKINTELFPIWRERKKVLKKLYN